MTMVKQREAARPRLCGYVIEQAPWHREDRDQVLAQVLLTANGAIGGDAARMLGELSVRARRHRDDVFNGLTIQSAPLPDFGDAAFLFNGGCSAFDVPARDLLGDLPSRAKRFLDARRKVARLAAGVRTTTEAVLAARRAAAVGAKLLEIGIAPGRMRGSWSAIVTLDALGHDLVPCSHHVVCDADDLATMQAALANLLSDHARRADVLDLERSSGSRGSVDQTAQRVLDVAGMGLESALDMLERRNELVLGFNHGRLLGRLRWDEGVLKGEVSDAASGDYVWQDSYTFWQRLPPRLHKGLIGTTLGSVAPRPYLPTDAIITSVADWGGNGTRIDLRIPTEPLART